eukprot:1766414-Amphidinium_carterae.2
MAMEQTVHFKIPGAMQSSSGETNAMQKSGRQRFHAVTVLALRWRLLTAQPVLREHALEA